VGWGWVLQEMGASVDGCQKGTGVSRGGCCHTWLLAGDGRQLGTGPRLALPLFLPR